MAVCKNEAMPLQGDPPGKEGHQEKRTREVWLGGELWLPPQMAPYEHSDMGKVS